MHNFELHILRHKREFHCSRAEQTFGSFRYTALWHRYRTTNFCALRPYNFFVFAAADCHLICLYAQVRRMLRSVDAVRNILGGETLA